VLSRLFLQEACLETDSSSASSEYSAISASDFNISKLTYLLHTALESLKEWQHLMALMQLKIDENRLKIDGVVEWQ
jgi:hypothetical protein